MCSKKKNQANKINNLYLSIIQPAPKVMPPIFMLVHNITGTCWRWGSRGWTPLRFVAEQQMAAEGHSDRIASADETKVSHSIPPRGKNGTQWNSSMLAEHLHRLNSGCENSEKLGGVSAVVMWHGRRAIFWIVIHVCKNMAHKLLFIPGENDGYWQWVW